MNKSKCRHCHAIITEIEYWYKHIYIFSIGKPSFGRRKRDQPNPRDASVLQSFTVFNVNPLTKSETLFDYFEKYGKIEKLMLLHDDEGEFNGSAGIVFV
jgi:hypothetical protein